MARHSATKRHWWSRQRQRPSESERPPQRPIGRHRLVEVVDAGDLLIHQLTPDSWADGRAPQGHYVALCAKELLPASLTEPGRGHCPRCITVVLT